MKYIPVFFLSLLFCSRTSGQSTHYTIQQTGETRQNYSNSVTTIHDTTVYRLTLSDTSTNGLMNFRLTMISYAYRMISQVDGRQYMDLYYDPKMKKRDPNKQMAYENLDATHGVFLNKEIMITFDPVHDSVTVLNADSIVKSNTSMAIGLVEGVKTYFSNDYFTGLFHSFLRTNYKSHLAVNAKWMQAKEAVSALQPRYADRSYTTQSVSKDSICVEVTGPSFYRDPANRYTQFGPKYCSGSENGVIVYRTDSFIPWRMDMHYVIIFQSNSYSSNVETWISDIRMRFKKE